MSIFAGNKEGSPDNPRRRATDLMPLSIVAHDLTVTGDLEAEGVVKIEGKVKGNIRSGGQILVAPGSLVEGDLYTKECVVGGNVKGIINATERVELQATAVIDGDIKTQRIAILEGARVTGEVRMDGSSIATT